MKRIYDYQVKPDTKLKINGVSYTVLSVHTQAFGEQNVRLEDSDGKTRCVPMDHITQGLAELE